MPTPSCTSPIAATSCRVARSSSTARPSGCSGRRWWRTPTSKAWSFDEGLLDDELARCRGAALGEAGAFEQLADVGQHVDAAAQHEAVVLLADRRQADVAGERAVGDQVGDAAA